MEGDERAVEMFIPYVNESADILQVVLAHGRIGSSEIEQVVVSSFSALELGLLHSAMPLHTHTESLSNRTYRPL